VIQKPDHAIIITAEQKAEQQRAAKHAEINSERSRRIVACSELNSDED